jgi:hypothetical protein
MACDVWKGSTTLERPSDSQVALGSILKIFRGAKAASSSAAKPFDHSLHKLDEVLDLSQRKIDLN